MKIAILGGAGKMGQWLADFLVKDGKQVILGGRDPARLSETGARLRVETASNREAAGAADVVVLSIPLDAFEPILQEISPTLRPTQTVIDISSVKGETVNLMHRYVKSAAVLGAHPLFGPGAKGFAGQSVVLTPTTPRETAIAKRAESYLAGKGARVVFMTPQEHDEAMSVVLGLAHFVGIVAADTLSGSGKLSRLIEVGGTSFKLLLTLAEAVVSEDPEFYASLQMNLPGVAPIEARFQDSAKAWAKLVSSKDAAGFAKRMASLRKTLEQADPGFQDAYRRMYRVNEALRDGS